MTNAISFSIIRNVTACAFLRFSANTASASVVASDNASNASYATAGKLAIMAALVLARGHYRSAAAAADFFIRRNLLIARRCPAIHLAHLHSLLLPAISVPHSKPAKFADH